MKYLLFLILVYVVVYVGFYRPMKIRARLKEREQAFLAKQRAFQEEMDRLNPEFRKRD